MENRIQQHDLEESESTIDVRELLEIVTKNWKWFLFCVAFFLFCGVVYLVQKNPVYEVAGIILLKEDNGGSSNPGYLLSQITDIGLGSMMTSNNVDNEVTVLNTRKIMKKTISTLNLHVKTSVKKRFRQIDLYENSPWVITVDSLQTDTMTIPLDFTIESKGSGKYFIEGKCGKEKFQTNVEQLPAILKTPTISVSIAQNPSFKTSKDIDKIDVSISNPNVLAVYLLKEIKIEPTSKNTTAIRLSMGTENIQKAVDIINTIVRLYNVDAIEDKNQIAQNTADFVAGRLDVISSELSSVEKSVEKYKQENKLTDLSSEAKLFLEQMSEYEKKRVESQIQLNVVESIDEYIKEDSNKNELIPSVGIEDKNLLAVIAKYNELLIQRNQMESSSSSSNPALKMLSEQLIILRKNISANVSNVKQGLNVVLNDLKKQDVLTSSRIRSLPRQEREFVQIERQHQIKEALYLFLLQKREEAELSLAATSPKAKIIDDPAPSLDPIAPKKKVILLGLLVVGLIGPFAFFYLRKFFKTEIDSKEELEKMSDAEIIGEISHRKTPEQIVVKPDLTSTNIELFRLLRTNLLFVLDEPDKKVILLTSTIAGEGKSFISLNLAMSFALTDKKVLAIGLDIRNPRLGEYMKLSKKKGITNYLSDHEIDFHQIIEPSGLHPNLDVIQAGPIPPNPNELLMKRRLDELFIELRERYDYIIVDSAPVGIVSDTFLLKRISDITLYVSRIGYVHRNSIEFMNSVKKANKLKNIYVVANDVDVHRNGYGYGYGSTEFTKEKASSKGFFKQNKS